MTIDALKALKEVDLREKILIPLFRSMGFQDVRLWHGGILEQGKDIVMWRRGDFNERVNYAVVVLAERISGQATGGGSAAKVATQVQQAVGHPFKDALTGEERQVHRVIVVSSYEIIKEARESINSILEPNLKRITTYIDGDKLTEEVNTRLPTQGAVLQLSEIEKAFQHSDPNVGIGFAISGGEKTFWFEDKTDGDAVTPRAAHPIGARLFLRT